MTVAKKKETVLRVSQHAENASLHAEFISQHEGIVSQHAENGSQRAGFLSQHAENGSQRAGNGSLHAGNGSLHAVDISLHEEFYFPINYNSSQPIQNQSFSNLKTNINQPKLN